MTQAETMQAVIDANVNQWVDTTQAEFDTWFEAQPEAEQARLLDGGDMTMHQLCETMLLPSGLLSLIEPPGGPVKTACQEYLDDNPG